MNTHFNWIGGIGPFSLYIHMNDDRTNTLQTYNNLTHSPFHWSTDISASDTRLQALLIDQFNGTEASSGNFTIKPSNDITCLGDGQASASSSEMSSDNATSTPTTGLASSSLASISFNSSSLKTAASPDGSVMSQSNLSHSSLHLPGGAIGGIVAGAVALLTSAGALFLVRTKCLRHRRPNPQHSLAGDQMQPMTSESRPLSATRTLVTRKNQRRQPRTILGDIVPTSEPQSRCSQDTVTVVTVGSGTVGIPNGPPGIPDGHAESGTGERPLVSESTSLIGLVERVARAILSEPPSRRGGYEDEPPPRYEK